MFCQILAAPLAESFTGGGCSVAEFGSQRFHESGPAKIVVEEFIHKSGYVIKVASSVYEVLIIGCGIGDVIVIPSAAVKLRVYPIQSKGYDGENICPKGAFFPGGINLAGGNVFYIVNKAYGHVLRV